MTTQVTAQKSEARGKRRSGLLLVTLALGVTLAAAASLAGTAREAEAAFPDEIVFASDRTTGTGVNNPTGDMEIFTMNPKGTGIKQLTFNQVYDSRPTLSPDGTKVLFVSRGAQTSNPEGDFEVYRVNAVDGSDVKNLSNNNVYDAYPAFSPDGTKVAYHSSGNQTSNPEGDADIYRMNTLDGKGKKNLSNTDSGVEDYSPVFSPDGKTVAYHSEGAQTLNSEGDFEVFRLNASNGAVKKNLSNNGLDVTDNSPAFSPDGKTVAYNSSGKQTSNPEGDSEVYRANTLDGAGKKNLSNNDSGVEVSSPGFSPDGKTIAYTSWGIQTSNSEGDFEVYLMNALDGTAKKNLSSNSANDYYAGFSPDGTKIAYESIDVQTLNSEGDWEVFRMNTLDGTAKKNLTNNGLDVTDDSPEWGR